MSNAEFTILIFACLFIDFFIFFFKKIFIETIANLSGPQQKMRLRVNTYDEGQIALRPPRYKPRGAAGFDTAERPISFLGHVSARSSNTYILPRML